MNFISATLPPEVLAPFALALLLYISGRILVVRGPLRLSVSLMVLAFPATVGATWGTVSFMDSVPKDQLAAISSTYGVELDEGQLAELRYPDERPVAEAVFGTAEVKAARGFAVRTVRLASDGERMLLVDAEGIELPHMGEK
jgi:hypothetical protein